MIGFTLLLISAFFALLGIVATSMGKSYNMAFALPTVLFFILGFGLVGIV